MCYEKIQKAGWWLSQERGVGGLGVCVLGWEKRHRASENGAQIKEPRGWSPAPSFYP